MNAIMKIPLRLGMVWGILFSFSCSSPPEPHPIPEALVRLSLDLSGEAYRLREPLGSFEVSTPRTMDEHVGVGGIVVVHGIQHGPTPGYYAYDMACPVEAPAISSIIPYTGGAGEGLVLYQCPSCLSVYELALGLGNPISGVARHPLRQYVTVLSGDILYVQNRQ